MIAEIIVFALSLVFLAKSSEFLIKSSIRLSKLFGIGEFAIGFILVAVSTSLPEIFVGIMGALQGNTGIVVGNMIGANIADILLVLGIAAAVKCIPIEKSWLIKHSRVIVIVSLIPLILVLKGSIGAIAGLLLVLLFIVYSSIASAERVSLFERQEKHKITGIFLKLKEFAVFSFCAAVLIVSAHFIVASASSIAVSLSISQALVGLTIVSIGTTLPELAVAVSAVRTGHSALAIGEVLGSCIVNLTLGLGFAAIIALPPGLDTSFRLVGSSVLILVGVNFLLWFVFLRFKQISRKTGTAFVLVYIAYILYLLLEAQNAAAI